MKKTVIIKLMGGLGNQMFQYAFGVYLQEVYSHEVRFDKSFFRRSYRKGTTPRNIEVNKYTAIQEPIKEFLYCNKIFIKIIKRIPLAWGKNIIYMNDDTFHYNKFKKLNILEGYWQDLDNIRGIRSKLIEKFSFENQLTSQNKQTLKRVLGTVTLSIHVRRGDYITNKSAASCHGACSIEYYLKSYEFMKTKGRFDLICIFSDDVLWCKKHLKFEEDVIYVSEASILPQEDIYMMSQCDFHIIANSTFSWWGAYLSDQKNIVYPKKWFVEKESPNLFPSHWIGM